MLGKRVGPEEDGGEVGSAKRIKSESSNDTPPVVASVASSSSSVSSSSL